MSDAGTSQTYDRLEVPLADGVHVAAIEVGPAEPGTLESIHRNIKVERVSANGWAVRSMFGDRLSRTSKSWDYEPQPSSRTDEWIAEHTFESLVTAIREAKRVVELESRRG